MKLEKIRRKLIIALTLITTICMVSQTEAKAWWTCIYPEECFEASVCGVVYEDGSKKEKKEMKKEDYEKVTLTSNFKIKSFFLGDL